MYKENKNSKLFFWCWKIWKNKNEDLKILNNVYDNEKYIIIQK